MSKLQKTKNRSKHSLNLFSSKHVLNSISYNADITHFHWFNNDTISLWQLNRFFCKYKNKCVVTLHDDWFFSGAEHYSLNSVRYIEGYVTSNKSTLGIDIDKWVFKRKLRLRKNILKNNVIFTAPSQWMVKRAMSSFLLKDCSVQYLPNIIDVDIFKPTSKKEARSSLSIPVNKMVIAFGAIGGTQNHLKGYDLLLKALKRLNIYEKKLNLHLLVFGGADNHFDGFDVTYTGHIAQPSELARIYSAADLVVVPSRIESFGQVAAESLACETPVVCFNNSAVAEIVDDGLSGGVVKAFNSDKLADKIIEILSLSCEKRSLLGKYGRKKISEYYAPNVVMSLLNTIYNIKNKIFFEN